VTPDEKRESGKKRRHNLRAREAEKPALL